MLGNILMYLIMFLYAVVGGGSTLVITGYLFVVIFQKLYGKIKHGKSLYS